MNNKNIRHVYIIGSKGIPAKYGGFETFVEKLTEYQTDFSIKYHVACMKENSEKSNISEDEFEYNNAHCFNINVPNIGPGKAVYYDILSLKKAIQIARNNGDEQPIFYILACRIGPFISSYKKQIEKIGGNLFVNPDGHEWKRGKWSYPVKKYWKLSERLMTKHADLMVCDSKNIEKYIRDEYTSYNPQTTYIAYGTETTPSVLEREDDKVRNWYNKFSICEDEYYLVVGRFVPENNYEAIISEFMLSNTSKDLVLITNVEKNKFYKKLLKTTRFDKDKRIKFVGTVYDQELLKYIRQNAFAYIHGHEVGGTNPSLLEGLYYSPKSLLLDVGFNKEVADKSAIYWTKNEMNLSEKINQLSVLDYVAIDELDKKSKSIILKVFNWESIISKYEKIIKG
ncbi:beta 1-4 rhamnosyltransferase Cps2T [Vagococcus lutrae]|uniref:beta 1-4 rhamnosyltransferase Cps2T n=1 Tax=Vagococcus lutrae TaxID=81947 RepID=UPI00288D440A|nr:DUF1972 domain-containing protein [Vagococcus lutrae]MDT2842082.1 DUF1972 domain-containing protein [Vagococcus lutrae]